FRADRDDGFAVGIEIDVVPRLVPVADRLAQPRNALRHGVAMRDRLQRRLDHLVNDVLGRGPIWITHPKVDNVFAPTPCVDLNLAGNVEPVRWEARNPQKLFHDDSIMTAGSRDRGSTIRDSVTKGPDVKLLAEFWDEVRRSLGGRSRSSTSRACAEV